MISKITKTVFNESNSIRLVQNELEKNNRMKTFFSENDRTPNTDGYFEVLDGYGVPLKRFVVQIKSVERLKKLKSGKNIYQADSAFFHYVLRNIDENPAFFFLVENSSQRIFFKWLSLDYLLDLRIGRKKSKSIYLDETDQLGEARLYDICRIIIREREVDNTRAFAEVMRSNVDDGYVFDKRKSEDTINPFPIPVEKEEGRLLCIPDFIMEKYGEIALLGSGGTSRVFSMTAKSTGQRVAMKVSTIRDSDSRPLLREFIFFDKIRHPSVPRVFDYFEQDGQEYILMDLIDGNSLQYLASAGALNLAEVLAIIMQVCDGADYMFHEGIAHRDLKPDNILIEKNYSVKFVDFGCAEFINDDRLDWNFMITKKYAAPEVLSPLSRRDTASEIFSIGATLYYMLLNKETRSFLCEKSSGLDLAQYIEEYSDDALGYGLYVLKKALAMNPEDRYVSIKKLQEDILIWQKEECLHPSRINLALAGSRDQFYKRGERRKPR